jgi:hypothetical protein
MLEVSTALQGATRPPSGQAATRMARVLVLGGGGPLGSVLLEQLLGQGRFAEVGVLVQAGRPMRAALRGLHPLAHAQIGDFGARTAVIVYDRERRAHGREAGLLRPQPQALVSDAAGLHAAGVRHLVIARPHSAVGLPQALLAGLANLAEGEVAALGFSHLVFGRMAEDGAGDARSGAVWPQRLAHWMLSQLRWLQPSHQAAVRAQTVAAALAWVAAQLPEAAPGSRVLGPPWWWVCAQAGEPGAVLRAWLAGEPPPQPKPRSLRQAMGAGASGEAPSRSVNPAGHNQA